MTDETRQYTSVPVRGLPPGRAWFYHLPVALQARLRAAKRATAGPHDWAAAVGRVRRREARYLAETAAASRDLPGRKRIAFFGLHDVSPVEYGLAMALHLRGHDVRGVLCDGLLPLCEMNLGPTARPPCAACAAWQAQYEEAFGFRYGRLQQFLSPGDRARAEALVDGTPLDERLHLVVDGVEVGRFAQREIQRYYRGFVFEPASDPAFRGWLVGALLLVWLSERWLDATQPDILALCSGRTLTGACAYHVARRKGIHVVTWDVAASYPDSVTFSHNQVSTEIPLDGLWPEARDRQLTQAERDDLSRFLGQWARSEGTPFPYNTSPLEDEAVIRRQLGLRPGVPVVAAFTNTSWDIAVIDRDVGFAGMFDWLFALVDAAATRPDLDFVVRAHPAERRVPETLRSRTPVCREIRARFPDLPSNVKLVEGDDPLSSYTLARMARINMLYASRLGLEIALRGRRPWIAGAVTYRDKGFTRDLTSKDHMLTLLSSGNHDDRLSPEDVALAERFAYLWLFRYEVRLPRLRPPDGRFSLATFRDLGPGGDRVIDRICDALVTGRPFVDLNRQAAS